MWCICMTHLLQLMGRPLKVKPCLFYFLISFAASQSSSAAGFYTEEVWLCKAEQNLMSKHNCAPFHICSWLMSETPLICIMNIQKIIVNPWIYLCASSRGRSPTIVLMHYSTTPSSFKDQAASTPTPWACTVYRRRRYMCWKLYKEEVKFTILKDREKYASEDLWSLPLCRTHITPTFKSLHLLPVDFRVNLKMLALVFGVLHGQNPKYIPRHIRPNTDTKHRAKLFLIQK